MQKFSQSICLIFLTSGCLMTEHAVLDATNSIPAGESAELAEYTRAEHQRTGKGVFREEKFKNNNKGKWAATVGALTIVTDRSAKGEYIYYGVGTLTDGTPLKCVSNTTNTKHRKIAKNTYGIKFTELKSDELPMPVVLMQGEKSSIEEYIFDEFQRGNLLCEISAKPISGG